ncbi:MAG TPA: adenosylcobinamide-GDP ribazoletransferase [Desulfobacteraceae bacterium]|nr:adenosylcobinamide-GDP ribazoletransferase [Desulfobacteraceae bacterium]
MKNLISAIKFITIIPIGKNIVFNPLGMVSFFPVVGIILGILVAIFDRAALFLWPKPLVSLLDVLLLVFLTGAFHLDGLGDTADGLLGHRPREKALSVMKDSRIGVMGLVAIIFGLSIKTGGIIYLDDHRSLFLIIIPAYSRGTMIFGIRYLNYCRSEGGTGHALFESPLGFFPFWGLLIPFVLSLFIGLNGIWISFLFFICIFLILSYYNKRMGCITGDMLGAMCEVTESSLFLMASMGGAL